MLKKSCLALVLLAGCAANALAQSAKKVAIDDLSAPQSPAFVLLGVAPTSIERPGTPKALGLNVLDQVTTATGFPRNYALQVAPYWLASHPNLQFSAYQNPSVRQSLLQTLLISVGTSPLPGAQPTDDPLGSKVGLGVRTAIFNGRANPRLERLLPQLEKLDDEVLDRMAEEDELIAALEKNPGDPKLTAALAKLQKTIAAARAKTEAVALQIQTLDAERIGFFLNIAGGQVWTFPQDDVREASAEKRGLWVTPSYRWRGCSDTADCESSVDAIAVVRTLKEPDKGAVWDYGGRVVWKTNKQLNVSLEALRRDSGDDTADKKSNRTVSILEYRIREDVILVGSFGQDFKQVTGAKPLVSFLGLNLGFGKKAVVGTSATTPPK
jgi:hypothetical protein